MREGYGPQPGDWAKNNFWGTWTMMCHFNLKITVPKGTKKER
jgi:hypothetical protein